MNIFQFIKDHLSYTNVYTQKDCSLSDLCVRTTECDTLKEYKALLTYAIPYINKNGIFSKG